MVHKPVLHRRSIGSHGLQHTSSHGQLFEINLSLSEINLLAQCM